MSGIDRRSGERERRPRARLAGYRDGPHAPRPVEVALRPAAGVGDGGVGLFEAPSQRGHDERVHRDPRIPRRRIPAARRLDRQRMVDVGQRRRDPFEGRRDASRDGAVPDAAAEHAAPRLLVDGDPVRPPLQLRCLRRDQGLRGSRGDIPAPVARNLIVFEENS